MLFMPVSSSKLFVCTSSKISWTAEPNIFGGNIQFLEVEGEATVKE